ARAANQERCARRPAGAEGAAAIEPRTCGWTCDQPQYCLERHRTTQSRRLFGGTAGFGTLCLRNRSAGFCTAAECEPAARPLPASYREALATSSWSASFSFSRCTKAFPSWRPGCQILSPRALGLEP